MINCVTHLVFDDLDEVALSILSRTQFTNLLVSYSWNQEFCLRFLGEWHPASVARDAETVVSWWWLIVRTTIDRMEGSHIRGYCFRSNVDTVECTTHSIKTRAGSCIESIETRINVLIRDDLVKECRFHYGKMNSEDVCAPFHLSCVLGIISASHCLYIAWLVKLHKIQETSFTYRNLHEICKSFPYHDCEETQA